MTEAAFTSQVLQLARLRGWKVAHFRPGMTRSGRWATQVQGDGVGFPDLFAVHATMGKRFAAELKVGRNKPTPEQREWLQACERAGIPAYVWRPEDWDEIEMVLEGRG